MSARSGAEHWHREWSNERGERIKADTRIATLERELAESKAREEQLRLDAARWALFRDTPSGTFDQYKDEWRFRCNVIGGMWCKSKDDAMDYALSKLRPSGHITQKGDTNADA